MMNSGYEASGKCATAGRADRLNARVFRKISTVGQRNSGYVLYGEIKLHRLEGAYMAVVAKKV